MLNLAIPSNSDSAALSMPKLCDDGSNWSDYKPHIHKALAAKGLWAHVEGKTTEPRPYQVINGITVLLYGKTPATKDQIEARETKVIDYDKRKYLAQHVILSTTSTQVGAMIKHLSSTHDMWEKVKADATTKSTLYLIDAQDNAAEWLWWSCFGTWEF